MAATHDLEGHEELSEEAQQLSPNTLALKVEVAERLLGVTQDYTGTDDEDVILTALAYQVNYLVESGVRAQVVGTEQRGDRQVSYRGGVLNPFPAVSNLAQSLVDRVLAKEDTDGDWRVLQSLR